MAVKQSVKIKLPVISKEFGASYSRVTKPTGVQYLLLTMLSMESSKTLTWEEMIAAFGIPEEIYEKVFKAVLTNMMVNKMIHIDGGINIEDGVYEVSLTPMGKEAFDKGVISQDPDVFSGNVYYLPAKEPGRKYLKDTEISSGTDMCDAVGFDEGIFLDIVPDDTKIENKVISNKKLFGVMDPEAEIFDFNIESGHTMHCYQQNIHFELDPNTGNFKILQGDFDDTFIKNRFETEKIVNIMDSSLFSSKSKEITFTKWNNKMPDWERFSFLLPAEVDLRNSKIVRINTKSCKSDIYEHMPSDLGYDIVSIESDSIGYEYYFVTKDVSISGFEGFAPCNVVLKRMISKENIAKIVKKIISEKNIENIESLVKTIEIVSILKEDIFINQLIEDHLSKTKNLESSIITLQNFKKESWYKYIPETIETSIVSRNGMKLDETTAILNRTMTQIDGSRLAASKKTGDSSKDLISADMILTVSNNAKRIIESFDLADHITKIILSGTNDEYHSKQLMSVQNASRNLADLKAIFHMMSLSNYSIDLEAMDETVENDVIRKTSTFTKEMNNLKQMIQNCSGYKDLMYYDAFFNDVTAYFKENMPLEKTPPITFAIKLGALLESSLKQITEPGKLSYMLDMAYEEGKVSEKDYEILKKFKDYRNKCAHEASVSPISYNTKKEWIETVKHVKPGINTNKKEEK